MILSESLRTTNLINGSHSDRLEKLTMENGECSFLVGSTKYKRRKVSAVRDFPAGCGRFAQRVGLGPTEDAGPASTYVIEDPSSKHGSGGGLENGTSDLSNELCQVVDATLEKELIHGQNKFLLPENGPVAVSNGYSLEKRVVEIYPPRRKVSAIREFPPFCGRNAPLLSKEESLEVLSSPKNRSSGLEKSECEMIDETSTEAVKVDVTPTVVDAEDGDLFKSELERNNSEVDVKQTLGDVPPKKSLDVLASPKNETCDQEKSSSQMNDEPSTETVNAESKQTVEDVPGGDSYKADLEGDGAKIIRDEFRPKREKKAMEDEHLISSELKTNQEGENYNDHTFEDKLYWWDHEFETVVGKDDDDVEGLEDHVGEEIVVNSEEKIPDENHSDASGNQEQLQVADVGSMNLAPNRVIVHGLVAPSNTLWQEKFALKCRPTPGMGGSKEKKVDDVIIPVERQKTKITVRKKVYASLSGSKEKKHDIISPMEGQYTKITARKKVDGNDAKGKSLKKIPPVAPSQGTGQLVIWNKEDSLRHNECEDLDELPISRGSGTGDVHILPLCPVDSSSKVQDDEAIVARHKVRETLRMFQAVYRKFLQEEEAKSKELACKRIDCKAANLLKEKNKFVNTEKIVGPVLGVEVGDEFQFRVELHIIGLHRPMQGGIDFVREGGKVLATSIVASGGYADDLDYSDVLIYTGQGGNVMNSGKEPEDQKLERGNLALKTSMHEKNPVRVIRGCELSDGKFEGKSRTYVYDGLYLVEKFWQERGPHGKLVFKFQLERIPGQPELAWKEVKKCKKYKTREGVCVADISDGKEVIPICAVNTIDDEKPPPFKYITSLIYPDWCKPTPPKGCNCTTRCSDSAKCSCAVKNGGEIPYNHNGAIVEVKPLVYECGPACRCPPSCQNRVSQRGIKFQLEIFKTKERGWGVRSLNFIPSGSFICEYLGEFLSEKEAEARTGNDEYLFDIGNNYNDNTLWDGLSSIMPSAVSALDEVVENGEGFTIDAAEYGNVGRFINHSCTPNLYAQNLLYDHEDKRIPHIMLFAAENIRPLEELTYHYNYVIDQVQDSNGNIKKKSCYCGSHECTGRLY